jgi:hypothetical protein
MVGASFPSKACIQLLIKLISTCSINLLSALIVVFGGIGKSLNLILASYIKGDINVSLFVRNFFTFIFLISGIGAFEIVL